MPNITARICSSVRTIIRPMETGADLLVRRKKKLRSEKENTGGICAVSYNRCIVTIVGIDGAPYMLTVGLSMCIFGLYSLTYLRVPTSRLVGYSGKKICLISIDVCKAKPQLTRTPPFPLRPFVEIDQFL